MAASKWYPTNQHAVIDSKTRLMMNRLSPVRNYRREMLGFYLLVQSHQLSEYCVQLLEIVVIEISL